MKNTRKQNASNKTKYYMHGQHAVLAAANNKNRIVEQIYCLPKQLDYWHKKTPHINIETVDNEFIAKKIGNNQLHQGVIALVHSIFKNKIDDLNFELEHDRVVVLDQVSDPQNIGAIIRSAAAFGINKLILPSDNTPDENATIAKAACGCLELMQIIKVPNLKNALDKLKKMNFWVAGMDISGKEGVSEILNIPKLAIVIGSEGKGMRKLTTNSCDFLVKIPIAKEVESLNASNAASIIFYLTQK